MLQRLFQANLACFVEVVERLVEGLHAAFVALLHGILDTMNIAFLYQVRDEGGKQHEFYGGYALFVEANHQALGDHRLEIQREVHIQLPVGGIREKS